MPIRGSNILLYEKKDKIVTITINRPERMNAISWELAIRMSEAWGRFRDDDDAWVAILTGTGDKSFCAGWDLVDEAERKASGEKLPSLNVVPPKPYAIWKPVIAAINGFAIAGGFQYAMECDIRIAAEHAEFGIAETRWNMPANWIVGILPQVGLGHALELCLWGDRRMTAQRGYEIGWINKVVAKDKLMDEARSWAERMLYLAPRCVRNLKQIAYRGLHLPHDEALSFGAALEQNLVGMKDSVEGPTAFAQKRNPVFRNE